jgi:hypothetical protein
VWTHPYEVLTAAPKQRGGITSAGNGKRNTALRTWELLSTTKLQQLISQGSKPTLSTSALLAANDAFVIFTFFPDFLSRDMQQQPTGHVIRPGEAMSSKRSLLHQMHFVRLSFA